MHDAKKKALAEEVPMKKAIVLLVTIALMCVGIGFLLSQQNQEDSKFQKTLDSYLDELWKFYPTAATMAGYHKYDNKLENLSDKSIEKRRETIDKFNQEFVAKIDKFNLSPELQIDHEIMVDAIDREILNHESLVPWEYNPLYYNDIILNSIKGLLKSESTSIRERLKNADERLNELPKFIKRGQESLKNPPQIFTETAIQQLPEIIKFYREELPKYYDQAPDIKSKIQASAAKAISSLEEYQTFLKNILLPRSDGNFSIGDAAHRRLIRLNFKNSIPLEDLIERARVDYKNIRNEMAWVCIPYYKIMYPTIDPDQVATNRTEEEVRNIIIKGVFDKIRGNYAGKRELVDKIRQTVEEIKKFINENQFFDLPDANLTIDPMPSYERSTMYTRLVAPGAYETSNKYSFQVAPIPEGWSQEKIKAYLEEYNNFFLPFWTIRKVFPGEFVPRFYANKHSSLVRKLYPNLPLLKGWPVYLEKTLVESGYGDWNLFLRLNQLKYYLRTAVDFLNDFNIHEGSMTKEQAIASMVRGGFQTEAEAERKWNHIALNPCDAAYIYLGLQEIADMEKEYRSRKGDAFNQKEFRMKLLSFGAIPIRLLKERILK